VGGLEFAETAAGRYHSDLSESLTTTASYYGTVPVQVAPPAPVPQPATLPWDETPRPCLKDNAAKELRWGDSTPLGTSLLTRRRIRGGYGVWMGTHCSARSTRCWNGSDRISIVMPDRQPLHGRDKRNAPLIHSRSTSRLGVGTPRSSPSAPPHAMPPPADPQIESADPYHPYRTRSPPSRTAVI
jgi:hypothetical protein